VIKQLSGSKKKFIALLFLVLAIPFVLHVLRQQQETRQRAAGVDLATSDTQIVPFFPSADTYVDASRATDSFSTETTLTAGGSPEKIAFLKYDLSSLAGKRIIYAKLSIYLEDESQDVATIAAAGNAWNEANVTYANQPQIFEPIKTFNPRFAAGVGRGYNIDVTTAVIGKGGKSVGFAMTSRGDAFTILSGNENANKPTLHVSYEDTSCPSTIGDSRSDRALPTYLGYVTADISIPQTQTSYKIWSRMRAHSNYGNSYWLVIDDECIGAMGDQTDMSEDVWTWVDFKYGVSTNKVVYSFPTPGSHTIKLVGREPGALLQQVLLVPASSSCIPTSDGSNCTGSIRIGAGQNNRQRLGPVHKETFPSTIAWRFGEADAKNLPLKNTNYPYVEAESVFVAKAGTDTNPGTLVEPVLTIRKALAIVRGGTKRTIVASNGTYRETGVLDFNLPGVTLQPMPGHTVWLDGAVEVTGFTPSGSSWVVDWPKENLFLNVENNAPKVEDTDPRAVDPFYPMSFWPDAVFTDGKPLEQVGSLAQVQPGKFFIDYDTANNFANPKLYIGDSPSGKLIEAVVDTTAVIIRQTGTNTTIRGLGFKRFGQLDSTIIDNGNDAVFENNTIAWSSGKGLAAGGDNIVVRGNIFLFNADNGIGGRANNVTIENNYFAHTNFERHYNWNAAGIKMTKVNQGLWKNNIAEYNFTKGFWIDISSENVSLINNTAAYNAEHGMMYEISTGGILASNILHHNGRAGMYIYDANDNHIWNNTFVDNAWQIEFADSPRLNADETEKARGLTYINEGNVMKNNIFSSRVTPEIYRGIVPASHIEADGMGAGTLASTMITASDKNAFYRKYLTQPQPSVTPAVVHWAESRTAGGKNYFFTDFPSYQSTTQQDRNSIVRDNLTTNPFFVDAATDNYVLSETSGLQRQGDPLPANIATLLGVTDNVNIGALHVTPPITATPTITPTPALTITPTPISSDKTYYISCDSNASDANDGLSQSTPWKTIGKVNGTNLLPGDSVLLKSGCSWQGPLQAKWSGTATHPITISSYGNGAKPMLSFNAQGTDKNQVMVDVSGTYQIIQNLKVQITNMYRDSSCVQQDGQNVPAGWYIGFSVSGNNNVIRNTEMTNLAAGVYTTDNSSSNKILNNHFHNLNAFWDTDGILQNGTSLGAIGINLHGNNNEYAYNTFENNEVKCALVSDGATVQYSAPFEVYNANRNIIHHNKAFGHKKHFEVGRQTGDDAKTCDDNILAYNLFVSDYDRATGPNIHSSPTAFGPCYRNKIYNNTIVFTGPDSQALVASGPDTITKNNILIAELKAGFYGGTSSETNNVYWDFGNVVDTEPDPYIQFGSGADQQTLSTSSKKQNPLFFNLTTGDFRLQSTSPAINNGAALPELATLGIIKDLGGNSISSPPEIGAFEFTNIQPTFTPTPTSIHGNGDANNDGSVNNSDLLTILHNYLRSLSMPTDQFTDGRINVMDFVRVLKQLP
jgi:parallel beta-helix repeat protein